MSHEFHRKSGAAEEALIDIRDHLPAADCPAAAAIYYNGLKAKLAPVYGPAETALEVLSRSFHRSRCLTAYEGDKLVGLLGIHDARGGFLDHAVLVMIQHYGAVMGIARSLLFMMLSHTPSPGDLYLDGLAVNVAHRGRGIGTALIAAFEKHARDGGFATVSLEVIDTNPRARRLYRRLGFRQTAIHTLGPFSRLYGFRTTCRMTKVIG